MPCRRSWFRGIEACRSDSRSGARLHISRRRLRIARICETNQLDWKAFGHCCTVIGCTYSLSGAFHLRSESFVKHAGSVTFRGSAASPRDRFRFCPIWKRFRVTSKLSETLSQNLSLEYSLALLVPAPAMLEPSVECLHPCAAESPRS